MVGLDPELAIQCSSNDCPVGLMNLFLQERTSCPSIEARARRMNRIAKLGFPRLRSRHGCRDLRKE